MNKIDFFEIFPKGMPTLLTDSNGEPIYDGDYVRIPLGVNVNGRGMTGVWRVSYAQPTKVHAWTWMLSNETGNYEMMDLLSWSTKVDEKGEK